MSNSKTDRDLVRAGLQDVARFERGEKQLRTKKGKASIDIRQIRENLGLSQQVFCDVYGVSLSALKNWEQGRRTPDLSAQLLLRLISNSPAMVAREMKKLRQDEVVRMPKVKAAAGRAVAKAAG